MKTLHLKRDELRGSENASDMKEKAGKTLDSRYQIYILGREMSV